MSAMARVREGGACGCSEADKYAASRVPPADVLLAPPGPPKLLHVRGSFDEAVGATLDMLREHGGAVWEGLIPESAVAEARAGLAGVMEACRNGFDADTDKLNVRHRDFGIVRIPMVRLSFAAKQSRSPAFHFVNDRIPLQLVIELAPSAGDGLSLEDDTLLATLPWVTGSSCYDAMDALAKGGRFQEVLSRYWGRPCSLSESGLSVTRPNGEGMEWHADGTEGEATVLVTLEDVHPSLGCLGVIPGSHAEYSTDKDGEETSDDARGAAAAARALWYPYRAGVPCIFDARTLHCAAENTNGSPGEGFRFVCWYIYNADEQEEEGGEDGEEEVLAHDEGGGDGAE